MREKNDTPIIDLRYPQITETIIKDDIRGLHSKFFGKNPQSISFSSYAIAEVFMTTNRKNVIRGLHYQNPGQPKIIQIISGAIIGNALCCDTSLPEFGTVFSFKLNPHSHQKIYIPPSWALGYRALENDTRVLYFAGTDYDPEASSFGIDPFDRGLALDWGNFLEERTAAFTDRLITVSRAFERKDAIVSERDKKLNTFKDFMDKFSINSDEAVN